MIHLLWAEWCEAAVLAACYSIRQLWRAIGDESLAPLEPVEVVSDIPSPRSVPRASRRK